MFIISKIFLIILLISFVLIVVSIILMINVGIQYTARKKIVEQKENPPSE